MWLWKKRFDIGTFFQPLKASGKIASHAKNHYQNQFYLPD
jgi:hypothetical protein